MGINPEYSIQGRFEIVGKSVPTFEPVNPLSESALREFMRGLELGPPGRVILADPLKRIACDPSIGGATYQIVDAEERRGFSGIFGRLTSVVRAVPVER